MKRLLTIILILALAGGAGFYFYRQVSGVKVGALEGIIPEDVLTYIYARNPAKNLEDFQNSSFFRQISAAPFYAVSLKPKLDSLAARLPFLAGLTEREIALALFSVTGPRNYRRDTVELGDFLFLARIDPREFGSLKKSLDDFYASFCNNEKILYYKYKGIRIAKFSLPKANAAIRYCRLGDCILITNSYPAVEKTIDLFRKQSKASLANYAGFQKAAGRVNKGGLLYGYTNNKLYSEAQMEDLRQAFGPDLDAQNQAALNPYAKLMKIMDASVFSVDYDGLKQGLICKSYQTFDRHADQDNLINALVSREPMNQDAFGIVPRDTVAYYVAHQDLPGLWGILKDFISAISGMRNAGKANVPPDFLKSAESFLGISIEDELLPLLGNNFGVSLVSLTDEDIVLKAPPEQQGAMAGPAGAGPEPAKIGIIFPQAYFFVELNDAAAMKELMEKLIRQTVENINKQYAERMKGAAQPQAETKGKEPQPKELLRVRVEQYQGLDLTILEIADFPAEFIQPNYCVLGKYFVFSLSPRLTKKVVDLAGEKGGSFSSNLKMESLRGQLLPEYSNLGFFDPEALVNNLRRTRFYKESTFLNKFPGGKFNKGDLELILDIISNIQGVVFTTRLAEPDIAETQVYIKIKGL